MFKVELDDIKLGMKVLVVRDRVEEGWTPILPDIADKFIGQVGRVIGMWIYDQDENNKGPAIRVTVNNGYVDYAFPPSSLEPCIPKFAEMKVDDGILFMSGIYQKVGVIKQVVYEKKNNETTNCLLFVEVESANSTTYAIVPTDHVISKVEKDSSLWCSRCISNT
jgi:hypothetical protein